MLDFQPVRKAVPDSSLRAAFCQEVRQLCKKTDMHLNTLKASEPECPGSGFKAVAWLMSAFIKLLLTSSSCFKKTELLFPVHFY